MKYIRIMTAVVGLLIVSGTIASAKDDTRKLHATLFTPRLHGDHFNCQVVNVSNETLGITIAVFDDTGVLLKPSSGDANPTSEVAVHSGTVIGTDFLLPAAGDGYCEVAVSGTDNRDDVRVGLGITLTRMIPGTNIPVFLFRDVEGH
jgi:hypothetical protein